MITSALLILSYPTVAALSAACSLAGLPHPADHISSVRGECKAKKPLHTSQTQNQTHTYTASHSTGVKTEEQLYTTSKMKDWRWSQCDVNQRWLEERKQERWGDVCTEGRRMYLKRKNEKEISLKVTYTGKNIVTKDKEGKETCCSFHK